ncbi:unnamed protein product [Toxocara canis]|uniref:Forty-two-three domain-containing protein 1 n=1 Tax=Toxocara canis TaxID=6265 RepID=A0A183UCP6_TOXCA|nr:unnamed protein product [Toxocara canis]
MYWRTGRDDRTLLRYLLVIVDDIIKKERADKKKRAPGKRGLAAKRGFGVRRNLRGGMRTPLNRGARVGPSRVNRNIQKPTAAVNKAATMRMVNKLVKKAISQRANQSLIRRAAMVRRRSAPSAMGTSVPFVARRAVGRGPGLFGRLRGVSQRSRVIVGSAARRARMQLQKQRQFVLTTPVRRPRGRGVSRIGQLVSDSSPMVYEREVVRPAGAQAQFVRQVPVGRQRPMQREVILEQSSSRPVIVQRTPRFQPAALPRYVRTVPTRGIRKNNFTQQRVIVVNDAQGRRRPQYRVQRVIEVEQPRARYVSAFPASNRLRSVRDAQLRDALGITRGRRAEPQRFEASSSFLQRVPVRKGRGFRNDNRFIY